MKLKWETLRYYDSGWFRVWPTGVRLYLDGVPCGEGSFSCSLPPPAYGFCEERWLPATPDEEAAARLAGFDAAYTLFRERVGL